MSRYKAVIIGLTAMGAQRPGRNDSTEPYGNVSESHASVYVDHPETELVAVCDLRQEMLDRVAESWGDVLPALRYDTDYRAMLQRERPELVSVVTPDHLHAQIVIDAANAGAKAILCEKPIATTLADADRMIAACASNKTILAVNHSRRWSAIYQQARAIVRRGELGALRTIHLSFFSKRAMLFRNGGHMIDMLHFLADSEAAWVWAELEEGFDHFDIYRGDGGHDPKREPSASGYIHFRNGVRAFYDSSKTPFPDCRVILTFDHGRLEVTDQQITMTQKDEQGRWSASQLPQSPGEKQVLRPALDELIQCVQHGGEPTSSGRSARQTLEVMLAMLQSHARGNVRVELP